MTATGVYEKPVLLLGFTGLLVCDGGIYNLTSIQTSGTGGQGINGTVNDTLSGVVDNNVKIVA